MLGWSAGCVNFEGMPVILDMFGHDWNRDLMDGICASLVLFADGNPGMLEAGGHEGTMANMFFIISFDVLGNRVDKMVAEDFLFRGLSHIDHLSTDPAVHLMLGVLSVTMYGIPTTLVTLGQDGVRLIIFSVISTGCTSDSGESTDGKPSILALFGQEGPKFTIPVIVSLCSFAISTGNTCDSFNGFSHNVLLSTEKFSNPVSALVICVDGNPGILLVLGHAGTRAVIFPDLKARDNFVRHLFFMKIFKLCVICMPQKKNMLAQI